MEMFGLGSMNTSHGPCHSGTVDAYTMLFYPLSLTAHAP